MERSGQNTPPKGAVGPHGDPKADRGIAGRGERRFEPLGSGTLVTVVESGYTHRENDLKTLIDCASGWDEALTRLKFYVEHGVKYGRVPKEE